MRTLVVIVHVQHTHIYIRCDAFSLSKFIFLLLHYECSLSFGLNIRAASMMMTPKENHALAFFTPIYYKYNKRSSIHWNANEKKKKTIRCVNSGNRNAEQEVRLQNVNSFFHFHSCRFANNCLEIRAMWRTNDFNSNRIRTERTL